jgi:hypothetical protein
MDRLRVLAETHGFFSRQDALAEGYDDNSIRRALKVKAWRRVRHGAYTFPDLWTDCDDVARHKTRARAVLRRLGDRVALSHTSAAVMHGLTLWNVDLSMVHVTRLDGGAGRTEAGVVHHEGFLVHDDLVEVGGIRMTSMARAAVETASLGPTEPGVVVLDSALREGCGREALEDAFAVMGHWPKVRGLQVAVPFADGRAESVGESRSRYLFYVYGLPAPELQYEVRDEYGGLVGITDFAWPGHKLLGEFDGKVKYGRLLRPDEDPGDAVFREKRREDQLREVTGWSMVRLVWSDLYDGAGTAARVRRMMRSAA